MCLGRCLRDVFSVGGADCQNLTPTNPCGVPQCLHSGIFCGRFISLFSKGCRLNGVIDFSNATPLSSQINIPKKGADSTSLATTKLHSMVPRPPAAATAALSLFALPPQSEISRDIYVQTFLQSMPLSINGRDVVNILAAWTKRQPPTPHSRITLALASVTPTYLYMDHEPN